MKPFEFKQPENAVAALLSANTSSQFIAGGTNQIDLMKKHINQPNMLLDITSALTKNIVSNDNGIKIDAMTTNSAVADHSEILKYYPLLSKAILAGASPQIRNMATTGGNLLQRTRCPYFYDITLPCNKRNPGSGCGALNGDNRMSAIIGASEHCVAVHPSDFCVSLAALDATVEIMKTDKSIYTIAFMDFHRLPENHPELDNNLPANALITSVSIPKNKFNTNFSYLKLRDRDSYAFALISVAAALELNGDSIQNARLASGGVAHKPWRWLEAETFLKGKKATEENFQRAAQIASKDTQSLSNNAYKIPMLEGAIETALKECITTSKSL